MKRLKSSPEGVAKLKQIRENSGRTVDSPIWLEKASEVLNPERKSSKYNEPGVNEASWRGFLYGTRGIGIEIFQAYCQVLEIPWQEVAEILDPGDYSLLLTSLENKSLIAGYGLRDYCKNLILKYEDKWAGSLYISEKGVAQDEIPVYASFYSDYTIYSEKIDLIQALRTKDRTILLGEPGAGKTTSLEKVCLEYAKEFYQDHSDMPLVLPILVRLSGYTGNLFQLIGNSLYASIVLKSNRDNTKDIEALLTENSCCLIFDGLNEVSTKWREDIIPELLQFMRLYSMHRYIISSRPQDDLWRIISADETGLNLVIQPIEYEDAVKYLILHLGEKIGRLAYGEVLGRFRDLLRLPLILWMFKEEVLQASLKLEDGHLEFDKTRIKASKIIPQNRGEMYQKFMSRFLLRENSKVNNILKSKKRIKEIILSQLALEMQTQRTLVVSTQKIIQIFNLTLKSIQEEMSPTLLLDEIQQSGLLIGEENIGFAHQTFQEFFAAVALCDYQMEFINQHIMDTWWSETLIFFSGIIAMTNMNKFTELLHIVSDIDPMLAVKCFIEGRSSDKGRSIIQQKLRPRLDSENWIDRKTAAEVLGMIGDQFVVPELAKLLDDPSGEVRWQAADALRHIPGNEAESALIKALRDAGWATRSRAAEALGRMNSIKSIPYLRPLLISTMPRERGDAAWSIFLMRASVKTPGISDLLQDSNDYVSSSVDLAIRASSHNDLINDSIKFISQNMESEKFYIRATAIHFLARLKSIESIPLIKNYLDDNHEDVIIIAMQSLATLNAIEYLPEIINLLQHPFPFVREIAAFCCSLFGSKIAAPFLLPLLKDSEDGVRFATVRTLGSLGVQNNIDEIIPLLTDSSENVRVQATITLGNLGDTSMDIINHLEVLLNNDSFQVQEAAIKSIRLIRSRQKLKGFFQAE